MAAAIPLKYFEDLFLGKISRSFPPGIHGLAAGEMLLVPRDDHQPTTPRYRPNQ
jgi:hypothetical protein